ncbi:MAG: RNA methyltransferase [Fuerstiella sp.]
MQVVRINSLDDSRLDVFRDLKNSNAKRDDGLFIAEGTTLVERLLHSSWTVKVVLASEQKLRNFRSRIPPGTLVYEVSRDLASELVGYRFHLGVVAAAQRRRQPSLDEWLAAAPHGLVLLGEHIIDPENVGLLIRIAAAFGASGIVLTHGSADAFSRRVLRVSMGNGLSLPVIEDAAAGDALAAFVRHGYDCFATVLEAEAEPLASVQFPDRTVIVVGNETHGVSDKVAMFCRRKVTIPMYNGTDSLNVSIAAGIFCHQYRAQYPDLEESRA